jgi:hypothetical protein
MNSGMRLMALPIFAGYAFEWRIEYRNVEGLRLTKGMPREIGIVL